MCPEHVRTQQAQALLESGVEVEAAIYNVDGEVCYRAFCHQQTADGTTLWHGHPIAWARLPVQAKKELVNRGRLDPKRYRIAIKRDWGREFES